MRGSQSQSPPRYLAGRCVPAWVLGPRIDSPAQPSQDAITIRAAKWRPPRPVALPHAHPRYRHTAMDARPGARQKQRRRRSSVRARRPSVKYGSLMQLVMAAEALKLELEIPQWLRDGKAMSAARARPEVGGSPPARARRGSVAVPSSKAAADPAADVAGIRKAARRLSAPGDVALGRYLVEVPRTEAADPLADARSASRSPFSPERASSRASRTGPGLAEYPSIGSATKEISPSPGPAGEMGRAARRPFSGGETRPPPPLSGALLASPQLLPPPQILLHASDGAESLFAGPRVASDSEGLGGAFLRSSTARRAAGSAAIAHERLERAITPERKEPDAALPEHVSVEAALLSLGIQPWSHPAAVARHGVEPAQLSVAALPGAGHAVAPGPVRSVLAAVAAGAAGSASTESLDVARLLVPDLAALPLAAVEERRRGLGTVVNVATDKGADATELRNALRPGRAMAGAVARARLGAGAALLGAVASANRRRAAGPDDALRHTMEKAMEAGREADDAVRGAARWRRQQQQRSQPSAPGSQAEATRAAEEAAAGSAAGWMGGGSLASEGTWGRADTLIESLARRRRGPPEILQRGGAGGSDTLRALAEAGTSALAKAKVKARLVKAKRGRAGRAEAGATGQREPRTSSPMRTHRAFRSWATPQAQPESPEPADQADAAAGPRPSPHRRAQAEASKGETRFRLLDDVVRKAEALDPPGSSAGASGTSQLDEAAVRAVAAWKAQQAVFEAPIDWAAVELAADTAEAAASALAAGTAQQDESKDDDDVMASGTLAHSESPVAAPADGQASDAVVMQGRQPHDAPAGTTGVPQPAVSGEAAARESSAHAGRGNAPSPILTQAVPRPVDPREASGRDPPAPQQQHDQAAETGVSGQAAVGVSPAAPEHEEATARAVSEAVPGTGALGDETPAADAASPGKPLAANLVARFDEAAAPPSGRQQQQPDGTLTAPVGSLSPAVVAAPPVPASPGARPSPITAPLPHSARPVSPVSPALLRSAGRSPASAAPSSARPSPAARSPKTPSSALRSEFRHDGRRARGHWATLRRWLLRSLFVVRHFRTMAEARDRASAAVRSGAVQTEVDGSAGDVDARAQGHSAFLSDAAVRVRRKLSNDARVTAAIRHIWDSLTAHNGDAFDDDDAAAMLEDAEDRARIAAAQAFGADAVPEALLRGGEALASARSGLLSPAAASSPGGWRAESMVEDGSPIPGTARGHGGHGLSPVRGGSASPGERTAREAKDGEEEEEEVERLRREVYVEFYTRLHRLLAPEEVEEDGAEEEVREAVAEDWKRDVGAARPQPRKRGGKRGGKRSSRPSTPRVMGYEQAHAAVFETVDTWTESLAVADYVAMAADMRSVGAEAAAAVRAEDLARRAAAAAEAERRFASLMAVAEARRRELDRLEAERRRLEAERAAKRAAAAARRAAAAKKAPSPAAASGPGREPRTGHKHEAGRRKKELRGRAARRASDPALRDLLGRLRAQQRFRLADPTVFSPFFAHPSLRYQQDAVKAAVLFDTEISALDARRATGDDALLLPAGASSLPAAAERRQRERAGAGHRSRSRPGSAKSRTPTSGSRATLSTWTPRLPVTTRRGAEARSALLAAAAGAAISHGVALPDDVLTVLAAAARRSWAVPPPSAFAPIPETPSAGSRDGSSGSDGGGGGRGSAASPPGLDSLAARDDEQGPPRHGSLVRPSAMPVSRLPRAGTRAAGVGVGWLPVPKPGIDGLSEPATAGLRVAVPAPVALRPASSPSSPGGTAGEMGPPAIYPQLSHGDTDGGVGARRAQRPSSQQGPPSPPGPGQAGTVPPDPGITVLARGRRLRRAVTPGKGRRRRQRQRPRTAAVGRARRSRPEDAASSRALPILLAFERMQAVVAAERRGGAPAGAAAASPSASAARRSAGLVIAPLTPKQPSSRRRAATPITTAMRRLGWLAGAMGVSQPSGGRPWITARGAGGGAEARPSTGPPGSGRVPRSVASSTSVWQLPATLTSARPLVSSRARLAAGRGGLSARTPGRAAGAAAGPPSWHDPGVVPVGRTDGSGGEAEFPLTASAPVLAPLGASFVPGQAVAAPRASARAVALSVPTRQPFAGLSGMALGSAAAPGGDAYTAGLSQDAAFVVGFSAGAAGSRSTAAAGLVLSPAADRARGPGPAPGIARSRAASPVITRRGAAAQGIRSLSVRLPDLAVSGTQAARRAAGLLGAHVAAVPGTVSAVLRAGRSEAALAVPPLSPVPLDQGMGRPRAASSTPPHRAMVVPATQQAAGVVGIVLPVDRAALAVRAGRGRPQSRGTLGAAGVGRSQPRPRSGAAVALAGWSLDSHPTDGHAGLPSGSGFVLEGSSVLSEQTCTA